jgi:hypothetical protein
MPRDSRRDAGATKCRRYKLPAAAGATAAGAAPAESTEAAAPTPETTPAAVAAATVASSASPEQEEVEQEFAQRGQEHDQENYAKNEQLFSGQLSPRLDPGLVRELWAGSRQLYAGILRYDISDPGGHKRDRAVIVILPEQRDGLAAKASDLAIGQDRLQPVADFNAVFPVLHCKKDQDAMVCSFAANTPLFVEGDGIAFNVRTIQGIHRDYGNLGVRFLVELLADVVQLRDGGRIQNVGEIVDIIGRTQLGDGFCRNEQRERQQDNGYADRLQKPHSA